MRESSFQAVPHPVSQLQVSEILQAKYGNLCRKHSENPVKGQGKGSCSGKVKYNLDHLLFDQLLNSTFMSHATSTHPSACHSPSLSVRERPGVKTIARQKKNAGFL